MKKNYFIEIAYKGTNYKGWQVQKNAISVQQLVNEAISTVLQTSVHVQGASRTDAGVHAKQNYAHFDLSVPVPKDFIHRTNLLLPKDISLKSINPVGLEANARFDASSRSYKYVLYFDKDPFMEGFGYYYPYGILNITNMNKAARLLITHKDFTAFCKAHTQVKTKECQVMKAEWKYTKDKKQLFLYIIANRFLRGMVRGIVGTSIKVGTGEYSVEDFNNIIVNKDRDNVDFSPPACGLYLENIKYPFKLS